MVSKKFKDEAVKGKRTPVKEEKPKKKDKAAVKEEKAAKKSKVKKEKRAEAEPSIPKKKVDKEKLAEIPDKKQKRADKMKQAAEEAKAAARMRETDKKKSAKESAAEYFNPLSAIDETLDSIEKDYGLTGSSLGQGEERLSTGMLEMDVVMGGGLLPGWYTNFGAEQSCKSTSASLMMISALFQDVPVIAYWDYEGSTSSEYLENMMEVNGIDMPIDQVFGIRDPKTLKWAVKPRVRYYSEGIAEKFFDYLAKLERVLPDKLKMNGQWYYVYEGKTPDGKIHKVNQKLVGAHYDKKYFQKTGKYRIPAPNGNLQAFIICDSYPAMLSERQDVDDPGSALAMQARMFSDQLKRVKGRMRAKRICVVGVNQLRKAPMVAYGNPEYEPGGESLKFYSDVRLRLQARVLNSAPGMVKSDKGMILEEKGVYGGKDKYRMIHIRAHKNKLSTPNLDCWMRLWIEDANGDGRGFDPVWDTWRYLVNTGQATGKRNQIRLVIKGKECKKVLSWLEFKMLILGTRKDMKAIFEHIGMKPFDLRAWCKDQLANKDGMELIMNVKRSGVKLDEEKEEKKEAKKKSASSDDDDDDED